MKASLLTSILNTNGQVQLPQKAAWLLALLEDLPSLISKETACIMDIKQELITILIGDVDQALQLYLSIKESMEEVSNLFHIHFYKTLLDMPLKKANLIPSSIKIIGNQECFNFMLAIFTKSSQKLQNNSRLQPR